MRWDIDDLEINPRESYDPAQGSVILGGASGEPTQGMPPFIMRRLSIPEWYAYVATYNFGTLPPSRVVLHHTVIPTRAGWNGAATMRGMQRFYANKGWTSAPHVYCAPDGIWLATPMYNVGIHAGTGNGSIAQGWYSVGLEMVGNYDKLRPDGAVWENSVAVMMGLARRLRILPQQLISFHRDYTNQKSCPGWAVKKDWVWTQVTDALTPPVSNVPYTEDSPLVGTPRASVQQFTRFVNSRGSRYTPREVEPIAAAIWYWAGVAGLNADLVAGQICVEASEQIDSDPGYEPLSSWWAAPGRFNFSGYGVSGRRSHDANLAMYRTVDGVLFPTWAMRDTAYVEGVVFPSIGASIRAQCGRLRLYAVGMTGTPEQLQMMRFADAVRPLHPDAWGSVKSLKHLGAVHNLANVGKPEKEWRSGWTWPGPRVGKRIADFAVAIGKA